MTKAKTLVHFLTAIALIIFGVVLFKIKSGDISMVKTQNADGSFDYSGLIKLVLTFSLCVLGFAGLITVLNDGEWGAWLGSAGVIVGVGAVGVLFDIAIITGTAIAGLYFVWWIIASVRCLRATWGGYTEDKIMAVCRFILALAMGTFVLVFMTLPDTAEVSGVYTLAGIASIVGAVAVAIEGIVWRKFV
ncbi:MAG: hypothetical protein IJY57_00890 [Clostridia bacterium]|nr:hypothetical protein [Clostridia bacterium]